MRCFPKVLLHSSAFDEKEYHVIYLTFYSTLLGWMISVELDEEKAGRLYLWLVASMLSGLRMFLRLRLAICF
jgi:hypothetical protein